MKKTTQNKQLFSLRDCIHNQLDSSFCWRSPLFQAFGLGALLLFIGCGKPAPTLQPTPPLHGGIDQLLSNLDQLKKESTNYESFGQQVQTIQKQQAVYTKSTEELRAELLSEVQEIDRQDFYTELQTIWKVGEHQAFFERQVSYCQLKIDLAVVGMGIIRIDEVLKEENSSVLRKDQSEFIKYVREQVQQAVASNDKNYKAIVFKGLESSSS